LSVEQTEDLRVALIGAGRICRDAHIPCLTRLRANIVCVVDSDKKALALLMGTLPSTVKYIISGAMDLPREANCAVICSPTALHAQQLETLLEREIHVLCEKPIACTHTDADRVVRLARGKGCVLQVGYFRRFHPATWIVRDLLRNGELGQPRACTVRAGHIMKDAPGSLLDKSLSGGGVLMDYGVHVIDRLYSWFDDLVLLQYLDDSRGGLEANAVVHLEGIIDSLRMPITMVMSRTSDIGYAVKVDFDRASIICSLNTGHSLTLMSKDPVCLVGQRHYLTSEVRISRAWDGVKYFCDQWREFCARIHGQPEQISSLLDAVSTTGMVESCYANRRSLELVSGW
jgi:predicted dehydrogenase